MQQVFFWTGQALHDTATIAAIIFSLLVLAPLFFWRHFYTGGIKAVALGTEHLHKKTCKKRMSTMGITLFSAILGAGQLAFAVTTMLTERDVFLYTTLPDIALYALFFLGGILFLLIFDLLHFRILGYVFISQEARKRWFICYQVSLWQLPLLFCIGNFLLLGATSFLFGTYFFIAVLVLWRLYLAVRAFRTLETTFSHILLFFLYLCTCEVVPIVVAVEVLLLLK